MKTINKKAILAMLVAMIMSLGVMGSISSNKQNEDSNLQQISLGSGYLAGATEGGWSGFWTAAAAMSGGYATTVGGALAYGWIVSGTNPAGWIAWGSVGVGAL
jgi:hypothetical protein